MFYQAIVEAKRWPVIRPMLKYPREKLVAEDEPLLDDDKYATMQFPGVFDENFEDKSLHDLTL